MKDNVDLTLDRVFASPDDTVERIRFLLTNTIGKLFPWQFIESNDLRDYDMLIITGNQNDRKVFRERQKYNDLEVCERCGDRIKPWYQTYGLCKNCENIMGENEDRCPWRVMLHKEGLIDRLVL